MKQARLYLFWAGILFTLVTPVYIGIAYPDTGVSWVAALCGAFVTFISRLDEIAELSLGPVRAKMRETIAEANATIEQLRAVAAVHAEATLTDLMAANFMDGTTLETRLGLHDKIVACLKEIGMPDDQLAAADEMWRRGVGLLYHRGVRHLICGGTIGVLKRDPSKEQREAAEAFQRLLDFETWTAATPEQMRGFFSGDGTHFTSEVEELIADYEHFRATGEISRRDVFVRL